MAVGGFRRAKYDVSNGGERPKYGAWDWHHGLSRGCRDAGHNCSYMSRQYNWARVDTRSILRDTEVSRPDVSLLDASEAKAG